MTRSVWTRLRVFLRSTLRRSCVEADMEEEIQFHLQAHTAFLIGQGMPPAEARRQARLDFGSPDAQKIAMRSAFGLQWIDELAADLRYAIRLLRKSPAFAAIAISSLALAIGANTSIFSVANQMLYARLAVPRPRELRVLYAAGPSPLAIHSTWGSNFDEGGQVLVDSFPFPFFRQLQSSSPSSAEIFAFKDIGNLNVSVGADAQVAGVQFVSGNFYSGIDVTPQLGRPILPSDDVVPGSGAVALLSDAFWHRTFGGSPAVLGRTLKIDGQLVTIIGVNPPGFTGAQSVQTSPALFLPLSMVPRFNAETPQDLITSNRFWWVNLMTRLRPGTSPALVAAALTSTLQAAVRDSKEATGDDHIPGVLLEDGSRGLNFSDRNLRKPIHILLGLSGLTLLLACANIANLMLARASVREREMSVRIALGASRSRVVRQVLTESLLLSVIGGALGLFLGYLGRNVLPRLLQDASENSAINVPFNWIVFVFAAAITLTTGLLFGILPALRATGKDPSLGLKEQSRAASRRRSAWSGKATVAFQIALSTLLVASSALFLRTLLNLTHIDPGFKADGLLAFDINPPASRYPGPASVALYQRLEAALSALPGVTGVTAQNPPFLADNMWNSNFEVEGAPPTHHKRDDMSQFPSLMRVGQTFFSVASIPILRGREFGPQDTATAPAVAVINQALAKRFFPNTDPIGRRFSSEEGADHVKHWRTIVGICGNTLYNNMRNAPEPLHFDLYRTVNEFRGATVLVRSTRTPASLIPDLRRSTHAIDPDLPMTAIRTQRQQISSDLQQERLFAALSSGFGLLALLLACVGIYGMMAYTVTQRTNEIGIRLALGATRGQVRGIILREAFWLSLLGVAAGLLLMLLLIRLVQSMLFGLEAHDPASLVGTCVLLLAVALLSCWIPAARASRVEPVTALRHE